MPAPRPLAEILGAHSDALKNDIIKVRVGTVTAVDPTAMTVDVQLAQNNPVFDELGNTFSEPAPSMSAVPLAVLRGGGFMVWMPVAVGDSVLLLFCDLSTDTWVAGDGSPDDPGFVGKHTYDSAFALPMIAPAAKNFADPSADAGKIIIGKDGATAQVRVSATDIELGNAAMTPIALATLIDSLINVLVASYTPAGPETGFAVFIAALQAWKTANWSGASPTTGSSVAKSQ